MTMTCWHMTHTCVVHAPHSLPHTHTLTHSHTHTHTHTHIHTHTHTHTCVVHAPHSLPHILRDTQRSLSELLLYLRLLRICASVQGCTHYAWVRTATRHARAPLLLPEAAVHRMSLSVLPMILSR
jgi:hypothetical protein